VPRCRKAVDVRTDLGDQRLCHERADTVDGGETLAHGTKGTQQGIEPGARSPRCRCQRTARATSPATRKGCYDLGCSGPSVGTTAPLARVHIRGKARSAIEAIEEGLRTRAWACAHASTRAPANGGRGGSDTAAPWLKNVLIQAAWAASRRRDAYPHAQFQRLKAKSQESHRRGGGITPHLHGGPVHGLIQSFFVVV
jgi:hypothetical protein